MRCFDNRFEAAGIDNGLAEQPTIVDPRRRVIITLFIQISIVGFDRLFMASQLT